MGFVSFVRVTEIVYRAYVIAGDRLKFVGTVYLGRDSVYFRRPAVDGKPGKGRLFNNIRELESRLEEAMAMAHARSQARMRSVAA